MCVCVFVCTDLLQCTHEPNVSVPQLAGLLIERTQNTTWVVVYKSLISTHTIMNYGNEARLISASLSRDNLHYSLSFIVEVERH